ncbi:pyridoxal phosphate-dependent aminotransferase [Rhodobacteraceae bacterium]|nr:pyridoxal phosphate-dependent aminotransferase [Paracoccaceae bacterium]
MIIKPKTPVFVRSDRAAAVKLSEIVRISEAVQARKAKGEDILSFGTGEPDFPTPENIIEAAHSAMLAGQTTYPPTQGISALREAIIENTASDPSAKPDQSEVIVCTGAKQVLANAFLATLNQGDEIIVPAPYWTSYADIVAFCQASLVPVACTGETEFKLSPAQLSEAITPKTKWLLLNSPGNPSGALYTVHELSALADILRANPHVWILADEIYQHISYDTFTSFREIAPDLLGRMLIVNGVSKAYAMTGWRLGWGIGPRELIATMVGVQGQSTSGASSISQAAALAALTGPQDVLSKRLASFKERRDYVVAALNKTRLLDCLTPGGAFYVFPSCEKTFGLKTPDGNEITTDAEFCTYILANAGVALVPGRAFGLPGHFRLSYAYAMADLKEGCARIANAVAALS